MSTPVNQSSSGRTKPAKSATPKQAKSQKAPKVAPVNILAIASFALGVSGLIPFAQVAGIILGHKALREIENTGERGRGLARAGLAASYVLLSLFVVALIIAVVLSMVFMFTIGDALEDFYDFYYQYYNGFDWGSYDYESWEFDSDDLNKLLEEQ